MTTKIYAIKSCKGMVEDDTYIYILTELIRNIKYIDGENKYYGEFLRGLSIKRGGYITNKYCANKKYYLVCETLLDNVIKRKKNTKKYTLDKYRGICKVETSLDELVKIQEFQKVYGDIPLWFTKINEEIEGFIGTLSSDEERGVFRTFFIQQTATHIILPNIVAFDEPFDPLKITEYINLLPYINSDILYEFLSTINFDYHIVGNRMSILQLTASNIPLLETIKCNIYKFVQNLFGPLPFNPYNCLITVTPDQTTRYFFIKFRVFDRMKTTKYSSFTEGYKNNNIDDVIYNLSNGVPLTYYYWSQTLGVKCKELYGFKDETEDNEDIKEEDEKEEVAKLLCILTKLKSGYNDIRLISSSEPLDKYHMYCSSTIIIELYGVYYKISIKSITFDELNIQSQGRYTFSQLKQLFRYKYIELLQKSEYRNMGDQDVAVVSLPARLRIMIKKMDNPVVAYTYSIMETASYYKSTVLNLIKTTTINEALVLRNLCTKLYYKNNNNKFNKICMMIPTFAFTILSCLKITNNFMICSKINNLCLIFYYYFYYYTKQCIVTKNKLIKVINTIICSDDSIRKIEITKYIQQSDDLVTYDEFISIMSNLIKETSILYQVWYIHPLLQEKNIDTLECYLTKLKTNIYVGELLKNNKETFNKLHVNMVKELVKDNLLKYTNFYELYGNLESNFLYNIRHIQPKDITDIIKIIKSANLSNMIGVMHYPNDDSLNIFHIQLYPKHYSSEDISGMQIDNSLTRGFLLDKYIDINKDYFMNKDIVLSFRINDFIGKSKKELEDTTDYKKIKAMHRITRAGLYN